TDLIAALRVIQLAYGDLTAKDAFGTAFEGYTFRKPVPAAEVPKLVAALEMVSDRAFGPRAKREVHLEFNRMLATIGSVKDLPAKVAAEKFLAAAKLNKNYAWTPAVVELLAALPRDKTLATLDHLWEQPHLADAVVRVLSSEPREGDQSRLVAGLGSLDAEVV